MHLGIRSREVEAVGCQIKGRKNHVSFESISEFKYFLMYLPRSIKSYSVT